MSCPSRPLVGRLLLISSLALGLVGCARERPPQVNFLIGGGEVMQDSQGGVEPIIDDRFGIRSAIGMDVPVRETDSAGSGVRLGGRVALSGYRRNLAGRTVAGEPLLRIEDYAQLGILTPQFTASYRQVFGDPEGGAGFIEPGVGLGLAFGFISFGSDLEFGDQTIGTDVDRTQSATSYSLSPFLRGGYTRHQYLIGLEGGYHITGLDFDDNLGRDAREWYVGLFFAIELGPR